MGEEIKYGPLMIGCGDEKWMEIGEIVEFKDIDDAPDAKPNEVPRQILRDKNCEIVGTFTYNRNWRKFIDRVTFEWRNKSPIRKKLVIRQTVARWKAWEERRLTQYANQRSAV